MNEKQRGAAVRGAFAPVAGRKLDRQTVILIDDVLTSCSTAAACAAALRAARGGGGGGTSRID